MKKKIVISAINFFEGGPLSVLNDCLSYLNSNALSRDFQIVAFIHKKDLFDLEKYDRITFIELPKSRKSYILRFYYEYLFFKKYSKDQVIDLWLSLHDITPNLKNVKQAVYCHNPSPFNKDDLKRLFLQPTQLLFKLFYKYVYKINIHKNRYVIVQQQWLRNKFCEFFKLDPQKIIVAHPHIEELANKNKIKKSNEYIFFYPAYPRPFKNFEVICQAVALLRAQNIEGFKVWLTINGTENKYAKVVYEKFKNESDILFTGLLSRDEVFKRYAETDCLIFPSKLETWGLPISEFRQFEKPILLSDLPYARETLSGYNKAKFFNFDDAEALASAMKNLIKGSKIEFDIVEPIVYNKPFAHNWEELFSILLN